VIPSKARSVKSYFSCKSCFAYIYFAVYALLLVDIEINYLRNKHLADMERMYEFSEMVSKE